MLQTRFEAPIARLNRFRAHVVHVLAHLEHLRDHLGLSYKWPTTPLHCGGKFYKDVVDFVYKIFNHQLSHYLIIPKVTKMLH